MYVAHFLVVCFFFFQSGWVTIWLHEGRSFIWQLGDTNIVVIPPDWATEKGLRHLGGMTQNSSKRFEPTESLFQEIRIPYDVRANFLPRRPSSAFPLQKIDEELQAYKDFSSEIGGRFGGFQNPRQVPPSTPDLSKPHLDYRKKGVMSPVKDQGKCGSCFASAGVSALESKYAMIGKPVDLSEEHVGDCSKEFGNNGCDGGNLKSTLEFMERVGVDTKNNYPDKAIKGVDGECRAKWREYYHRIEKWEEINGGEEAIMEALDRFGPVVSVVFVDGKFTSYHGGIFTAPSNSMPNHAILLVGYGHENGTDVWYIKNSWGNWGNGGYMTIQRNIRGIGDQVFAIVSVKSASSPSEETTWILVYVWCLIAFVYICASLVTVTLVVKNKRKQYKSSFVTTAYIQNCPFYAQKQLTV